MALDRVVLVVGEEELLALRAVAGTVEAARESAANERGPSARRSAAEPSGQAVRAEGTAADPEVEVRDLEAAALSGGEVAELLSPSLFGGARVVVVRRGQDARKDLVAALLAYAAAPEPDVTLVVVHAGGAKGKQLADGLREAGATVVPAGKLTRHRERVEFVRGEVRRLGGRCGDDAAEALLAAVGSDLRELAAACSQLVADTDGRLDTATVARYYRGRAEVSGFTVADAAMVGDTAGALEALRWALQVGVPVVPIADALADGVRTVARVASAGRGSAYQLAGRLGLPPWKVERGQRQARGWSPEGLVEAMQVAAACNAAVKGGGEDSGYALERAVVLVTAARGGGR
ncbi:MAG: DNA polymerase III subunit delta [Micromonosporaceae bacterium]|nr:DNA polymerase III subunit delta [Micromonosporaceae bacterium]